MRTSISSALNELYNAIDASVESREYTESLERALDILQDGLLDIEGQIASNELIDVMQSLSDVDDIASCIYELEVINNELDID